MADLRAAILSAAQAADRLHLEYDTRTRVDAGEGRVDVFDMLVQQDIPTMFQKLDKLLGAFLDEDGSKGVILTTQRQLPVQRYTAAHELGHATLGHQPSADLEEILARSPFVDCEDGRYNAQEIQANVFASQLLIPRWLLVKHMQRQQWSAVDMTNPDIVYQLSLRLGASYAATCHALQQNKVFGTVISEAIIRAAQPASSRGSRRPGGVSWISLDSIWIHSRPIPPTRRHLPALLRWQCAKAWERSLSVGKVNPRLAMFIPADSLDRG